MVDGLSPVANNYQRSCFFRSDLPNLGIFLDSQKWNCATYRVLLLLDLNDGAVLEGPLDDVGLLVGALDVLAALKGGPELAEVLDLDEVPDVRERGADDGRLADGGTGGNGRHLGWKCGFCVVCCGN